MEKEETLTIDTQLDLQEDIARAEDLANLLDHIAWKETLLPDLRKYQTYCYQLMGRTVLGHPITLAGKTMRPEELAGRAEGINFIIDLMEKILTRGTKATQKLLTEVEAATHA